MPTDICERLRNADVHSQQRVWGSRIFGEAADTIESLRAEVSRLSAELEEARKKHFEEAAQVAIDHAVGAIELSKRADADSDTDSRRIHVNDAFALRGVAAAIRQKVERDA